MKIRQLQTHLIRFAAADGSPVISLCRIVQRTDAKLVEGGTSCKIMRAGIYQALRHLNFDEGSLFFCGIKYSAYRCRAGVLEYKVRMEASENRN